MLSTSTVRTNVRVSRVSEEAQGIRSFELLPVVGEELPPFSAGSHIDVYLPSGVVRQYSLCNDPREAGRYVIAVLRAPESRGGSEGMHALEQGQTLVISHPRNHFALSDDAEHHVLVAGGIGVTPILSMAHQLVASGRSFELHYCARSESHAAFVEYIKASELTRSANFHFDDAVPGRRFDVNAVLNGAPSGSHLYVCGPSAFMEWVLQSARTMAWPEVALHKEHFAGTSGPAGDAGTFEVKIASTGAVISVKREETVVAALARANVHVETSCEQGVCGTCLTRVLEGVPEHLDMYLSPEEQERGDRFLPCCSRSRSALLVLDL